MRLVLLVGLAACGPSVPCPTCLDLGQADFTIAPHDMLNPPGDLSRAGDLAAALKQRLDRCNTDAECASPLACRALYRGGVSRCTATCPAGGACLTGERCLADPAGGMTCQISDVGRACAAAADCRFGCLTSQAYCTVSCVSGADCPNGFGCQLVGTPAQRVCVKVEADCSVNANACIAPSACDTTTLVSSCTMACNSAGDCPQRAQGLATWTCDAGGICRRPGDVYGPLGQGTTPAEYACNAGNIDFGAFTIPAPPSFSCPVGSSVSGAAGDACVDSCLYQGGCAFGAACTAVGSIGAGSRIGLCLPSNGSGEVGTACTTDGQCAFGYCQRTLGACSRDCTVDGVCPSGSTCSNGNPPAVEGLTFRYCK